MSDLPVARFWEALDLVRWEGFWIDPRILQPAMTFRTSFHARDDDVLLASTMKSGTTWLKSLALSCFHRDLDLLATNNPHLLLPTVEAVSLSHEPGQIHVYDASAPRLLHTHLSYFVLSDSLKAASSSSKIVYIARNPKDTLISSWHFYNSIFRQNREPFPLEKAVDCFCSGVHQFGPFFDHVAEYWTESQKRPEKILFLKYEELKSDPKTQVSKMAEFMGKPFRSEEEVEEVLWRCSLERLKNLEVNKNGTSFEIVPNRSYFRKGQVEDWKNYLTPEMEHKINQISRTKLEPIGLFL